MVGKNRAAENIPEKEAQRNRKETNGIRGKGRKQEREREKRKGEEENKKKKRRKKEGELRERKEA